jgi:hypothetical protein
MKKILLIIFTSLTIHLCSQQWAWAAASGSTKGGQAAIDICSDGMSNVFIIGENHDTTVYGGIILDSGSFVAKYNAVGMLQWAQKLPGTAKDIICDATGNLYIAGNFTTSANIGSLTLVSNGMSDLYVIKLNPQGNFISVSSYGGPKNDDIVALAVDNMDNLFMTGSFQDSILFGNHQLKCIATNSSFSGNKLMYLTKVSSGNIVWARTCPYNYINNPYRYHTPMFLKTDKNGSAYITGIYDIANGCQMYCYGYFIVKYNSGGTLSLNQRKWNVYEQQFGLAVDDSLNILVEFNCGSHYTWCRELHKYDSLLNTKWTKFLGDYGYGTNYTFIYGLSVDKQCNIYVAGLIGGQGSPGDTVKICNDTLTGKGATDILAGKFNSSGNCEWTITAGGSAEENFLQYKNTMHVDQNGNCYLTGIFNSSFWSPSVQNETVYFGNDSISSDGTWQQIYVAKINNSTSVPTSLTHQSQTDNNSIKVFPNPSSGVITVQFNCKENKWVRVYDHTGSLVKSLKVDTPETKFELPDYQKGIYFLEVDTETEKSVKKLVVQ